MAAFLYFFEVMPVDGQGEVFSIFVHSNFIEGVDSKIVVVFARVRHCVRSVIGASGAQEPFYHHCAFFAEAFVFSCFSELVNEFFGCFEAATPA